MDLVCRMGGTHHPIRFLGRFSLDHALYLPFLDIYITKFVPWGFWKNSKNEAFRKTMEWVDAIVFALIAVYFINTFFFQNYQIPTSSLEKSLLVEIFWQ